ncbi:MAG: hypothetical protein F6K41_22970 [Symploca sp. SIO3E6]|nr:hypothetical protein [Caldora sp. SIO3E6]
MNLWDAASALKAEGRRQGAGGRRDKGDKGDKGDKERTPNSRFPIPNS